MDVLLECLCCKFTDYLLTMALKKNVLQHLLAFFFHSASEKIENSLQSLRMDASDLHASSILSL